MQSGAHSLILCEKPIGLSFPRFTDCTKLTNRATQMGEKSWTTRGVNNLLKLLTIQCNKIDGDAFWSRQASQVIIISWKFWPRRNPIRGMRELTMSAKIANVLASCPIAVCRTVLSLCALDTSSAIRPNSLFSPTAMTRAFPSPESTVVPEKTQFTRSARGASGDRTTSTLLSWRLDSPVSEASLISNPNDSISRASTGTLEPSESTRMSPTTTSTVGTSCIRLSRITLVVGAVSSRKL